MKLKLFLPALLLGLVVFGRAAQPANGADAEWTGWQNSLSPAGAAADEADEDELVLIDHGKTNFVIVLAEKAVEPECKAAEELARWLAEMSNVPTTVSVVRENAFNPKGQPFISVGRTKLLATAGIDSAKDPLGDEGYGIAVKDGNLFIWGGRTRGPVNAAFALLEEDLGCRWYTDQHFQIPKSDRVAVRPVARTYQPPFMMRDPFLTLSFNAEWSLRNRTNAPGAAVPEAYGGRFQYAAFHHSLCNQFVARDKYFKDHPEYYMLAKDGKRSSHQLCTTNPDVIRIATEEVLEKLRNSPTAKGICVSKDDGGEECLCERCAAVAEAEGCQTGPLLVLVNAVAEAVEKEFPHVIVETLAYVETVRAPKTLRPRKNVAIRMCNDDVGSWKKPFTPAEQCEFGRIVENWAAVHDNLFVWDYAINFNHYLAPMPNFGVVADNLRFYADHHVRGVMTQSNYETPGSDREWMRSWVFAKLMWNPQRDVRQLMRDFTWGHYGPAAEPIWKYNERLDQQAEKNRADMDNPTGGIRFRIFSPFLNEKFLAEASRLFDKAEAACGGDEDLLHRVELARLPILYAQLMQGMECINEACPPAMIDKFEKIAKREKITGLTEHFPNLDDQIGLWRRHREIHDKRP